MPTMTETPSPATRLLAPLGGQVEVPAPPRPDDVTRLTVLVDPATAGYLSRAATHHRRVMTPWSRDAMTFADEPTALAWQATADGVAGGRGAGPAMEPVSLPVGWFGLA
jgi:hypothetical protein